ncbi:MAG TPA: O-antigen ligase family protein [Opitutaceae bacterium]|jgi:O-antigen ligase|nr:O-antigen ligase family protein [Opitutaceae bacterium]
MNPRLRIALFTLAGVAIGMAVAGDIADESYGLAAVAGLACCWLILRKVSDVDPDAWALAAALVGYIVGNRGFAQLQPTGGVPLLPAEAVLLIAAPTLVARAALKKDPLIQRDALNFSILAWIIIGTIRLPLDVQRYGIIAVRDYAMVYYASFFFIAQALSRRASNMRILIGAFTAAFVFLIPVVISILIAPDFLLDNLTWNGIPLIYHKSDLIANSLAVGFFWLWTRWEKSKRAGWLLLAAASLLLISKMASPRAAMIAAAITTVLWIGFRRWRIALAQVGLVALAALIAVVVLSITGEDVKTSAAYSAYEHAISIFDPTGSGTYINGESGDPGDNNRFRLVWWKDVIEDTSAENPILGLGFGTDLAARFAADYGLQTDETFAARSPHSIIVTNYGRMGLLGLACWLVLSAFIAKTVYRVFKKGDLDAMGLCCVVTVTWVSACVGVVLESPMAAVFFWTALGLAHGSLRAPEVVAAASKSTAADWPIAKPVPVDTY